MLYSSRWAASPALALHRQIYLVLIHQRELFQMGVRMKPQESLRNLLYTQAASVQSEEHPKQLLRVSDKNMQPHNKKVIPSITMKKKELKERNPPEMNK